MPANLTDADTFEAIVQAPADGDTANAATFQLAPQDLANRTRYLYNRMPNAYGTWGDEDKTITAGTEWHQTVIPTANRVVTLDHTAAPTPKEGQPLRAVVNVATTWTVTFQREDASTVAVFTGPGNVSIDFIYTDSSGWIVSTVEVPGGSTASPWSSLDRG